MEFEKLQFDWNLFTEEVFKDVVKDVKAGEIPDDEYRGCVRVGNLCFDLVLKDPNSSGDVILFYDLYVGGVDTGYKYSDLYGNDQYPYDHYGNSSFDDITNMPYKEFKEFAEKVISEFITQNESKYKEASLINKAKEKLCMW